MKKLVVIAALTPLAATGAASEIAVDRETLQRAIPASAMLESDVETQNDRGVGQLEDMLMTRDGKLRVVLVDVEDSELGGDDEQSPAKPANNAARPGTLVEMDGDMTAKGGELDRADVNRGEVEWGEDLVPLSPRDVRYDANADDIIVRDGAGRLRIPESRREELLSLDEIIGMEVNLADEESFGSVEDVMLNGEQSRAVALVVDNWDGFDKQRRALPVEAAIIQIDEEEIVYPYTLDDLKSVAEFDLDGYSDDGWDMD